MKLAVGTQSSGFFAIFRATRSPGFWVPAESRFGWISRSRWRPGLGRLALSMTTFGLVSKEYSLKEIFSGQADEGGER